MTEMDPRDPSTLYSEGPVAPEPPEDEQWASQFIEQGEVRVIDTIWGHFAGLGMNAADNVFVDRTLRELLDRPA